MNDGEKVLLGSWLMGYNLEDMEKFTEEDFSRPDIFNCLKSGKNNFEVHESLGIPILELYEIQNHFAPSFYTNARYSWLKDKLQRKIMECTTPEQATELLREFVELQTMKECIKAETNLAERFEETVKARANREIVCYGLQELDNMTLGLHRTELTTIGARPAVGKSTFALQIALNVVEQGQKVLYFPLEMSTEQTLDRIAMMYGYTDAASLRTGRGMNKVKFNQALGQISALELSGRFKVYEGKNRLNCIAATTKQEKPFLVVIDQLTQLTCNQRYSSKREQFSYMTSALKRMAMEEKIAVILLAQINRTAQDTPPTMAQLKESGSIEEDSDNVILLHRMSEEELECRGITGKIPYMVDLAKQRSGEAGKFGAVFYKQNLKFFSTT